MLLLLCVYIWLTRVLTWKHVLAPAAAAAACSRHPRHAQDAV